MVFFHFVRYFCIFNLSVRAHCAWLRIQQAHMLSKSIYMKNNFRPIGTGQAQNKRNYYTYSCALK